MRSWTILGLEGLSDESGLCELYTAAEVIRRGLAAGGQLTEQDIEGIARMYGCRVKWED